MSFIPFQTTATGSFDSQPSSLGEKLVLVSNDPADDDPIVVSITGLVSGVSTTEAKTMADLGNVEVETTAAFESVTSIGTSSTLAGAISVYGQGIAGVGDVRFDSVPVDGDTLVAGVTGLERTYTYVTPAYFILSTGTAASVTTIADSDYFDIAISGTTYRFWFEIDGAGGVAPSDPGVLTKVSILSTDTNALVATTLEASMESAITGYSCAVSDSTITVVKDILATAAFTFTDGAAAAATGITYTLGDLGLADAANQIRTSFGPDAAAATTTDAALWTQYAVNATGGTAGTHYGTGTVVHAHLSGLAVTSVITLTDRVATARIVGWVLTAPSGGSARTIAGGAYGTLIGVITNGNNIRLAQNFENADLADANLLALFSGSADPVSASAGATDPVLANGQPATLRLAINNVTSAVVLQVQASDDGSTWYTVSGTTALTGTVSGTAAAYAITGSGTAFTTELRVGDVIIIATYAYVVASIASTTSLSVTTPLVTSPSGASATKQLPVQVASLDNNSQIIPIPPFEWVRLNFTTNGNTTDSNLHAGLIL